MRSRPRGQRCTRARPATLDGVQALSISFGGPVMGSRSVRALFAARAAEGDGPIRADRGWPWPSVLAALVACYAAMRSAVGPLISWRLVARPRGGVNTRLQVSYVQIITITIPLHWVPLPPEG